MGEVLPYLEIKKDNESEEDIINKVIVPDLEGKTFSEAKKILKDLNLNIDLKNDEIENIEENIITEQIPVAGVEVFEESTIIVK